MSGKNPYGMGQGAPPKYINDFSKALAAEVKILLQEVGQLRDERRALQFEIAELMAVKSKYGAGGEYTPDWKPREAMPPPPPEMPVGEPEPLAPAKPAWRTVHVREDRHKKTKTKALPAPAPGPAPMAPQPQLPAWAQWKPNPLLSPAPRAPAGPPAPAPPPPRPQGLFGEDF